MAIIIDASAVIAVAANEPTKARLIELTLGQELISPVTLPWEVGNAVSAMFKQKRITLDEGLALVAQYRQIPIMLVNVDLNDAIRIASAQNIYAYDAYLIQCSLQVGHPILSLDRGLQRAARNAGAQVLETS